MIGHQESDLTIKPTWTEVDIPYLRYEGASDVFARSPTTFTAQSLAKRTPARDQARQSHFNGQLQRLSEGSAAPTFRYFYASKAYGCAGRILEPG